MMTKAQKSILGISMAVFIILAVMYTFLKNEQAAPASHPDLNHLVSNVAAAYGWPAGTTQEIPITKTGDWDTIMVIPPYLKPEDVVNLAHLDKSLTKQFAFLNVYPDNMYACLLKNGQVYAYLTFGEYVGVQTHDKILLQPRNQASTLIVKRVEKAERPIMIEDIR